MNAAEFSELLTELDACEKAVKWAKGKSLHSVWTTCKRGDWLLWLCGKMVDKPGWATRQEVVLAACACAETALPTFEKKYPNDKRPYEAIETARKWAGGEASIEDVRKASTAAADAAYESYEADAAYEAAAAAYTAASAAYDAAAYAGGRSKSLSESAEIVRKLIAEPKPSRKAQGGAK